MVASTRAIPNGPTCAARLAAIGKALLLYASDHNDLCPNSLDDLTGDYLEPKEMICPENQEDFKADVPVSEWSSYRLIPGLKFDANDVPSNTMLAFCAPERHSDRCGSILFTDGLVQRVKESEFKRFLDEQGIRYVSEEP